MARICVNTGNIADLEQRWWDAGCLIVRKHQHVGRAWKFTGTESNTKSLDNSEAQCKHHGKEVKVAQLCPTLCDPMDYTVHGLLQARILEWVAFPFSRGSSKPRDWTDVSHFAGRFFTIWATREALLCLSQGYYIMQIYASFYWGPLL